MPITSQLAPLQSVERVSKHVADQVDCKGGKPEPDTYRQSAVDGPLCLCELLLHLLLGRLASKHARSRCLFLQRPAAASRRWLDTNHKLQRMDVDDMVESRPEPLQGSIDPAQIQRRRPSDREEEENFGRADEGKDEQDDDAANSEDELSDLDEEQFKDVEVSKIGLPIQAVDEEVYKIGRYKRKPREGDDRPKKERRKRRPVPEPEPDVPLSPETLRRRELDERMDAALKPKKQRVFRDEDNLEEMQDDEINHLRDVMKEASQMDRQAINEHRPATQKLKTLPIVMEKLQKTSLYNSILENNLLESIKLWLEPLPDSSLPSFNIQRELFSVLAKLPIQTQQLRESGLARVVLFYRKSIKPEPSIKRVAEKLIGDWTRPIVGRSDNYRDKAISFADYDPEALMYHSKLNAGDDLTQASPYLSKNRTSIPTANAVTYSVAPRIHVTEKTRRGEDPFKNIQRRLQSNKSRTKAKAPGVSIEGRNVYN